MSAWTEDRDVGTMPARQGACTYSHSLVGFCSKCGWTQDAREHNEEMRKLRTENNRLKLELDEAKKDLVTRDQQLTEARLETRRVEGKLMFVQQRLALHEGKP